MPAKENLRTSANATGRAQLSMLEHALCPLDLRTSLNKGLILETSYAFTDTNRNRKKAKVKIGCVDGLSPLDELFLWGLLGLALAQPEPSPDFYATPYWVLCQLGKITPAKKGSEAFRLMRESVGRLSGVRYQNSAFYDPIRSEHRQVSFGLLNYSLPMQGDSARAWRFAWDPIFWELVSANRSSLRFDMALYYPLSAAARRMYLFLKKQFWRNEFTGGLNLRETAVNVLGFSESLATKTLRSKLERIVNELMDSDIVQLGESQSTIKDCFVKRGVGEYQLRLHRGPAFDRATPMGASRPEDSPLYDPLKAIGFNKSAIARLINQHSAKLLSQWADITLAAQERGLIDQSPQAYFTYYVQRKATPHDWWLDLKKEERQREYDQQRAKSALRMQDGAERGFDDYVRTEAKEAFENVMNKLVFDLTSGGTSQHEAQRFAREQTERHFRNRYRKEKLPNYDKI
jgi:hypothetical protein